MSAAVFAKMKEIEARIIELERLVRELLAKRETLSLPGKQK